MKFSFFIFLCCMLFYRVFCIVFFLSFVFVLSRGGFVCLKNTFFFAGRIGLLFFLGISGR